MLNKFLKKEKGDVMILFAGVFIILLIFLGLSTDVILAFSQRDRLVEIGNSMRDARVDLGVEVWNSPYPEHLLRELTVDIGVRNGLRPDQITTKWNVKDETNTRRDVGVIIELTDVYECSTLKMLGIKELPIKVVIGGSQYRYAAPYVWSPRWDW